MDNLEAGVVFGDLKPGELAMLWLGSSEEQREAISAYVQTRSEIYRRDFCGHINAKADELKINPVDYLFKDRPRRRNV